MTIRYSWGPVAKSGGEFARVINLVGSAGRTVLVMPGITQDRAIWLSRNVLPHEAALRNWLSRWRIDTLELDDIVQETYAILASRESVGDIRNPRAYLFQTARSVVLMHLRHAKIVSIRTVEDLDRLDPVADDPSPEEQTSDREQLHRLAEALGQLPEQGRRAVYLRFVEGLSQREIGCRMGISENAVQKQIVKSVEKLAKIFGRGGKDVVQASTQESRRMLAPDGEARIQSGD
jgi:RNA polymerase sigma-70 factor (ECF subfamily)